MMKTSLSVFALILTLALTCQDTMAQEIVFDGQFEEETETDSGSQDKDEDEEDQVEPSVRPQLKRVSEISLNLFDQPSFNEDGGERRPEQSPVPASNCGAPFPTGASPKSVAWTAPDVAYNRLIFEEPGLERHGFTDTEARQHLRSSAKFFTRSIALPIIAYRQRCQQCDNNLGWGTTGTCPK